jgi:sugar lactone lactonase YvrE
VHLYFNSTSNSLLIANCFAHNIVRWATDASSWTLVAGNFKGTAGSTLTGLNAPFDVTMNPMGNVYVADRSNHRIQFFPAGQSTGTTIAGVTGAIGINSTCLSLPSSVVLDNQLNLYVADTDNQRIQKFLRY